MINQLQESLLEITDYNLEKDYKLSSKLEDILQQISDEKEKINYLNHIIHVFTCLEKDCKNLSKIETIKLIYDFCDDYIKKEFKLHNLKPSCSSGCSNCCHVKVTVTKEEVEYISQNIDLKSAIDIEQLLRQVAQPDYQDSIEYIHKIPINSRKCAFLKDNKCSIYEFRPLACRLHYSISNPELCDTSKGINAIESFYFLFPEIYYAYLFNISEEVGSLHAITFKKLFYP